VTVLKDSSGGKINHTNADVKLRAMPYPYRAMLAICSDLDETPNKNTYLEIMQFLNTTKDTAMGPGVGLEVGNSIYFDMPPEQFAYWNTDDAGREMVRMLIRSGHIDCLHSYGDLATKRKDAQWALEELDRFNCKLEVWIDHGTAVTNFGSDIMQGHGDQPGHPAYHADLTTGYGIKYIWRGRVTSIMGQDIPGGLVGIYDSNHPAASARTLLKETAKHLLACSGNKKYSLHSTNELCRPVLLRDNQPVFEFIRSNPHWGGVNSCDQGRHISKVLTKKMLHRLVTRGGFCLLYTHLGKIDNPDIPFNREAVNVFQDLADAYRGGEILITTTRRLLGYHRTVHQVSFKCIQYEKKLHIAIDTKSGEKSNDGLSAGDLSGLTFYVPQPKAASIEIDGRAVTDIQCNGPDHTGRLSISLPRSVLEFPQI
jgi:hypothetical protein